MADVPLTTITWGWSRHRHKKFATKKFWYGPFVKPMENSNLKDWNCTKRMGGQIRLKEKRSIYAENWKWETDSSKKCCARNCQEIEELRDRARKLRIDELSISSWITFRICRTKWIPRLTQENCTILRPRAALERSTFPVNLWGSRAPEERLAAILDCRSIHGILWVFQDAFLKAFLLKKDHPQLSSKIQGIWHNLRADCDRVILEIFWNMEEGWDELRQYQLHVFIRELQPWTP